MTSFYVSDEATARRICQALKDAGMRGRFARVDSGGTRLDVQHEDGQAHSVRAIVESHDPTARAR